MFLVTLLAGGAMWAAMIEGQGFIRDGNRYYTCAGNLVKAERMVPGQTPVLKKISEVLEKYRELATKIKYERDPKKRANLKRQLQNMDFDQKIKRLGAIADEKTKSGEILVDRCDMEGRFYFDGIKVPKFSDERYYIITAVIPDVNDKESLRFLSGEFAVHAERKNRAILFEEE
jgi:hypothetical protein